jgi:hypothetical protein
VMGRALPGQVHKAGVFKPVAAGAATARPASAVRR